MNNKNIINLKEEFETIARNKYPAIDFGFWDENCYWTPWVDALWQGFLMAKLSQPTITLPRVLWADNIGDSVMVVDEVKEAITKAGYNYEDEY